MKNIFNIMWRNKIYVIFFIFIVVMNLLIFADKRTRDAENAAVTATEHGRTLFSESSVEARQEKIRDLAVENPRLYFFMGLLNLAIIFIIFIGLFLDAYFVTRWLRKKPPDIRIEPQTSPKWNIADVARVAVTFIFFGYIFIFLQMFLTRLFPVFNNGNFRMVFSTLVMNTAGIIIILYFIIRKHGQSPRDAGLTLKKSSSAFFYAVIGYIAFVPILIAIMLMTFSVMKFLKFHPPMQPIVQVLTEEKEMPVLWFSVIFAAVLGPITEEIFFRGFMYKAVRKRFGIFCGMISTAVLFSLLHTHIAGFLPIVALGLLLAWLYEKTGSLVASMSVHIMHNVVMIGLVFLMRHVGA
ncbi:MAG: type II CAAX endopeptidase family protein [Candidatus Omnitrophota bacterium]